MPTPFTHLAVAQRLLSDDDLTPPIRTLIERERPAFLLGNVAADARVSGNVTRETTHFFAYDRSIQQHPWQVMLTEYPSLCHPRDDAQRAFLAGYVAHLSIDELWSIEMVRPYFFGSAWGTHHLRFLMLHAILIYMDERDYASLAGWQRENLCAATPDGWTPFLSDAILSDWRDFIAGQLPPGTSQTLAVFGGRINVTTTDLRALLDDPARMERDLWQNVPRQKLADVEAHMYAYARAQMIDFLGDSFSS